MPLEQKKILMNANFLSQFGYCRLVWMSFSREMKNLINHFHERALRIVCEECKSSFQQLFQRIRIILWQYISVTYKLYHTKSKNKLSSEIFNFKESHHSLVFVITIVFLVVKLFYKKPKIFQPSDPRFGTLSLLKLGAVSLLTN